MLGITLFKPNAAVMMLEKRLKEAKLELDLAIRQIEVYEQTKAKYEVIIKDYTEALEKLKGK